MPRPQAFVEEVRVLAQRGGVLLAYKPAALPTESTPHGERSLVSELSAMFDARRVHAASRLDVGVSGVVLCTTTKAAAGRVSRWREAGQLRREYIAIVASPKSAIVDQGSWEVPLGRLTDRAGRHKSSPQGRDPRPAVTRYRVVLRCEQAALLLLWPQTGRMHQLRAHTSGAGLPIYGDRRYGGASSVVAEGGKVLELDRVALHARCAETPEVSATAPLPAALTALWSTLGGPAAALAPFA